MFNTIVGSYTHSLGQLKGILEKAKVMQETKKVSDEAIAGA
jgi:hypothetical protein